MDEKQSNEGQNETPDAPKGGYLFREIVKSLILVLIIVIPFRIFIAQPFIVNGASMDPTFDSGQYLIVDQLSFRFEEPNRGAVIIFKFPLDQSKHFIKRIIGLPGETVKLQGTDVVIKNESNPQGYILKEPYLEHRKFESQSVTLEDDEYFVMGDNRTASSDSRLWGPLKKDLITGRPLIRLLPLRTIDMFPGAYVSEDQLTDEIN